MKTHVHSIGYPVLMLQLVQSVRCLLSALQMTIIIGKEPDSYVQSFQ